MDSEKLPIERRWRNAIVLFLGICIARTIIALIPVRVLPSNMEWAGLYVPIVIATIGSVAGIAGCLSTIIVVQMRMRRS
jgi:hypothetical protein